MDTVKFVPMLVGLLITVVMVGAVFVPVVASSTTQTITTEIENDGAEWLKLGYKEGEDYSFNVGFDESDNFNVGTQTGTYEDMICYADSERTLFISGDNWYLLTNGETPSVHKFTDTATVSNASGTLTILDGSDTVYIGASPTWAYVPDANGVYGFFTEGGLNLEEGKPKVAIGSYAGVFAYNDTVVGPDGYGNLGLTMSGDYAENEVIWSVAPSEPDSLNLVPTDSLDSSSLDLDPAIIQPIDLGGSGSVGLMSADPTTGTQVGDLYYTFVGEKARIVGYSSSADWSIVNTLPDTVTYNGSTYSVTSILSNAFNGCTALALTSLPDTITNIADSAFKNCTHVSLNSLPPNLTYIGIQAFSGCTDMKGIVIPAGVTFIGNNAFSYCTNVENLIIIGSPTINNSSFDSLHPNVLDLSTLEITTTTGGMRANNVQDYVNALGYIAPTSIHETEVIPIDSPTAKLMSILPLIAGVGALLLAVSMMIYTRW